MLLIVSSLMLNYAFSQELTKGAVHKTKVDAFTSKTGAIIKYIDKKLPRLKTDYGSVETRIRKYINGANTTYFYQIEKEDKYGSKTASIEFTDLMEVIKALKLLNIEVVKDAALNADYLENKFISEDGFQVGYYVSGGAAKWYINIDKYGTDNTLFIDSSKDISDAFEGAVAEILLLKNYMSHWSVELLYL